MSIEQLVMWQGYLLALVLAGGCWFKSRGVRQARNQIREAIVKYSARSARLGGDALPWITLHEIWERAGGTTDEWFVRCDKRVRLTQEPSA